MPLPTLKHLVESVRVLAQAERMHVLAKVSLPLLPARLGRLHSRTSTQWNRADGTRGRQVWYRFTDRAIRSDQHFYATVNYIHANPVKHGLVGRAVDWPWSSLADYTEEHGLVKLSHWWRMYPPDQMGAGWDDDPGL